jgi:hypothetical protein
LVAGFVDVAAPYVGEAGHGGRFVEGFGVWVMCWLGFLVVCSLVFELAPEYWSLGFEYGI